MLVDYYQMPAIRYHCTSCWHQGRFVPASAEQVSCYDYLEKYWPFGILLREMYQ
jgi:hypothetical protein